MENTNFGSKRFCAYCGKEIEIGKKRCEYCGSILSLPVYDNSQANNVRDSYTNNVQEDIHKENTSYYNGSSDYYQEREEEKFPVGRSIIITVLMCLIPAAGPLFGLVMGFIGIGAAEKGSTRYLFGKYLIIASAIVLIYHIILYFIAASFYVSSMT